MLLTQELPKGPHTSHHAKGVDESGPQGFGQTDLVVVHPILTRGGCSLVLKTILGVFRSELRLRPGVS
jgi:hypothetical protein